MSDDRYPASPRSKPPPTSLREADDPILGTTLAERYRVQRLEARGGMARVYRAYDTRLARHVAVKVLAPPYADDPDFVARFLGEARAAASITHSNLLHVYDSGSHGALHFIVMELLEGYRTLRQVIADEGRLPRRRVAELADQLLAGLGAVHERGLVHCDVKASNVMLGDGPVKLIDFGIAVTPEAARGDGRRIGSLPYMAPEQLRDEPLTASSDLYALGATLYEALTGTPPYAGATPDEVSRAQSGEHVRPPSALVPGISERLDAAILQSLRTDPRHRFHSAEAMARALAVAFADGDAHHAQSDTTSTAVPVAARARAANGYVPPPAPAPTHPPVTRPRALPASAPVATRRRASTWQTAGTAALLVAVGLVVVLLVVPLLELGQPNAVPSPAATPATEPATPAAPPSRVEVPPTIGMDRDAAIDAAEAAGLNWRLECAQDPQQPEGIIDQEPPAGTEVDRGSRFTMYSARIQDCRGGGD